MAPEIGECGNTVISSTLKTSVNRALKRAVCEDGLDRKERWQWGRFERSYRVFLRNNRSRRTEVSAQERGVVCLGNRSRIPKDGKKE